MKRVLATAFTTLILVTVGGTAAHVAAPTVPSAAGASLTVTASTSTSNGSRVSASVITCMLQINNAHKSSHVPRTINITATYSCTAAVTSLSLNIYLYLNDLPPPWHIWSTQPRPDVNVREISTAAGWAEFVTSYPVRHGDLVYPDWRSASRDHDGVHLTLRAIAATQGIYLRTQGRIVALSY